MASDLFRAVLLATGQPWPVLPPWPHRGEGGRTGASPPCPDPLTDIALAADSWTDCLATGTIPRHDPFTHMNLRYLAVSLAVLSSFAAGTKADALSVTTAPVSFKAIGTPTTSTIPATLNFQNFSSLYSGPGTLKKVRWVISTPANVGGQTRITNQSTTSAITPLASNLAYSLKLTPSILGAALQGGSTNATTLTCLTSTMPCSNSLPAGDEDTSFTRTFNIGGTYQSSSVYASLTSAQVTAFTSGAVTSSYDAVFIGGGSSLAWNFNPTVGNPSTVTAQPFIDGTIALQYEYELPPAQTPGPLPLVGAAAAFGWSRRLRNRIAVA